MTVAGCELSESTLDANRAPVTRTALWLVLTFWMRQVLPDRLQEGRLATTAQTKHATENKQAEKTCAKEHIVSRLSSRLSANMVRLRALVWHTDIRMVLRSS